MSDSNELVVLENTLKPLSNHFEDVLEGMMSPERLIRSVVIAATKTPKILGCTKQSVINAAMSAAVLGIEPDGVTGQSFILPFGATAQLVIGYKGYNTLASRSDLTITGEVVREGDEFDYSLGTNAFLHHKAKLGNTGRIIASWAIASHISRPPIISILSIDEIQAIKAASPGGKKSDSPWNNPTIGFPAMASKSSKRRLARSTPLVMQNPRFHLAARMDEAFEEQGRHSYIGPDKNVHVDRREAIESSIAERDPVENMPTAETLTGPKADPFLDAGKLEAAKGIAALEKWWVDQPSADRVRHKRDLEDTLKPIAWDADETRERGTAQPAKGEERSEQEQAGLDIIEPSKPAAPTDDASYRAYALAWVEKSPSSQIALDKWGSDAERDLRTACKVSPETREHLIGVIRKAATK